MTCCQVDARSVDGRVDLTLEKRVQVNANNVAVCIEGELQQQDSSSNAQVSPTTVLHTSDGGSGRPWLDVCLRRLHFRQLHNGQCSLRALLIIRPVIITASHSQRLSQ